MENKKTKQPGKCHPILWKLPALAATTLLAFAAFAWNDPGTGTPNAVIELAGDRACHTQGATVAGGRLFVSCVERISRRAILKSYNLPEGFPEAGQETLTDPAEKDLTRGGMYHPSGLDHDSECLWVATAHYRRRLARSVVMCIDPLSMEVKRSWKVDDHIGGVAVMGESIVALNWGSRNFYRFSREGELLSKDPSPTDRAYQDCAGVSEKHILCSAPINTDQGPTAAVELLEYDSQKGWEEAFSSAEYFHPQAPLGREGFTFIGPYFAFVPEDYPGARMYIYSELPWLPVEKK